MVEKGATGVAKMIPFIIIDQNGKKVLIKTGEVKLNASLFKPFQVYYQLIGLGSKVLVIPAGENPESGTWWFGDKIEVRQMK